MIFGPTTETQEVGTVHVNRFQVYTCAHALKYVYDEFFGQCQKAG